MDKLFNFQISANQSLSNQVRQLDLKNFEGLVEYVRLLPYGRNEDRSDFSSILNEQKGTCSTKHAFLAQVALENNVTVYKLMLGIYKMQAKNTPGVKSVLEKYDLSYIPEAHCYLKYKSLILDFTGLDEGDCPFEHDLLIEVPILPKQIGQYKINYHKDFLKTWLLKNNFAYTLEDIWTIREEAIKTLS